MKQTARIISVYTADVSGVASALFELGGMTVMHDASGCNSTYNTHDEPRWYDHDSLVFISALTEMEAIMGDDEKLIRDVTDAALELRPRFVAIAGTPIPMMIGTDFQAVAARVEKNTGIPCFGLKTNSMHSYLSGASMAFEALAKRFCVTGRSPGKRAPGS
jgi:nitrogenase molybdenum-cofactor synthesis protein NifE